MLRVNKTPQAEEEILEIGRYIARQSGGVGRALGFLQKFDELFEKLRDFPELGPMVDDKRRFRTFPINDYLVFYRVLNECIEIGHVVRSDRELEAIFRTERDSEHAIEFGMAMDE